MPDDLRPHLILIPNWDNVQHETINRNFMGIVKHGITFRGMDFESIVVSEQKEKSVSASLHDARIWRPGQTLPRVDSGYSLQRFD